MIVFSNEYLFFPFSVEYTNDTPVIQFLSFDLKILNAVLKFLYLGFQFFIFWLQFNFPLIWF